MKTLNKKLSAMLTGMFASVLVGLPAYADDTEIYVGQNLGVSEVPPNILFVVDTSGSMSTNVVTQTTYNPATTYSGSCSTSRVYYSASKTTNCSSTSNYFNLSNLQCKAAVDAFAISGYYQDNMAMWRSSKWSTFSTSAHTSDVECKADSNVHGNGGSAKYAANGSSGPWSTSSSSSITWSAATNYTVKSGNYLNWEINASTTTATRIQIVKDTLISLVNSINNVNIGLMRFDSNANGGMMIYAMEPIATAKTNFIAAVNSLPADSNTPLAETMYEAALYFRGGNVDYGNTSYNGSTLTKSVAASRTTGTLTGTKYKSPIEFQCQKNFITYLTDGDPTSDIGVDATRQAAVGVTGGCSVVGSGGYKTSCLDDIAKALASNDQSTAFAENQVVSTFTIGFGTGMSVDGETLLKSAAAASKSGLGGAGAYYPANDSAELTAVFTNILTDILGVNATFSSPAVSVNAFNRTTHRDDLYFSLFKPTTGPHWDGNLKRFKLTFDTHGEPIIVDASVPPQAAVNPINGYFYDTSTSYWTPAAYAPDGKEAPQGGAASKLTNNRKIYSYMGSSNNLTDATNLVSETNAAITATMLGVASSVRDNVLKWARGIDVKDENFDGNTTEARLIMGDPLHGEPAMVQYDGPDTDPDITAYVPTNEGYLHAISTKIGAGTENFSFVPSDLFSNIGVQYTASSAVTKTYGLDGSITAWVQDQNKDGVISTAAGDKVYLYFGMRRGGKNYYALDVSDRANPKMLWTIKGGSGNFTELTQTWSQPQLRKLKINGADKYVLIFAGGYDTNQDAVSTRTADTSGRAIYIVDALTGARLWWASSQAGADLSLSNMNYSMPSTVAAADADGDGYSDLVYVGDMGGQIWRFDIAKGAAGSSLSSLITGGRIADIAASGSTATNRRFYYPPSVALNKSSSGTVNIVLGIASGYREHPLNLLINDRIYMFKDTPVYNKPSAYVTLTEANLFDTTDNIVREGTDAQRATAKTAMDAANGWYIKLETTGEKGLAKGLIFGGYLYISSYVPKDTTSGGATCAPSEGSGRLYIVSVNDGGPLNTDSSGSGSGSTQPGDLKVKRYDPLVKPGIPADPKMIKTSDPNQKDYAVCVGTQCRKAQNTNLHEEIYWFER